jgi:hypothetical protein
MLGSGNRLMELTKYGQDMGSQEYDNQFDRLNKLLTLRSNERSNMFGSLAGTLGSGALGRGGTDSIWGAYGGNRNAKINADARRDSEQGQYNYANSFRGSGLFGGGSFGRSSGASRAVR